ARCRQPEFCCLLALRVRPATTYRGHGRDLFYRDRCGRSGRWLGLGHYNLSPFSNDQCRSTQSAQRMIQLIVANLWLIPAAPLAVSLLILALSSSRRGSAAALAIAGQVIALVFATAAFLPTLQTPGYRALQNFVWFTFGDQPLRIGWVLDPLAAAMVMMITLVGLCIFVFSVGYMADDRNFTRFFSYLSFFSAAMLGLVIANSLLLLF